MMTEARQQSVHLYERGAVSHADFAGQVTGDYAIEHNLDRLLLLSKKLVICFSKTLTVDSAMIGLLITLQKRRVPLVLYGLPDSLREKLIILQLDTVFRVAASEEEAIEMVNEEAACASASV